MLIGCLNCPNRTQTVPNNVIQSTFIKNWIFLFVGIMCCLAFIAGNKILSSHAKAKAHLENITYFVDTEGKYDIANIMGSNKTSWESLDAHTSSLGMSDNRYWFTFTLRDVDPESNSLLEIDYPMLNQIDVWFVQDAQIIQHFKAGDALPFSGRPILHQNFIFPVPKTANSIQVYLSIHTSGAMRVPLYIWQTDEYISYASKNTLVIGMFIGLMLAVGSSNLFFFVTTRATPFLIYSGYVVCLTLTLVALSGIAYRYIWPNYPWLQHYAVGVFANLSVCLSIIFCNQLLNVKAFSVRLSQILKISAATFIFGLAISIFMPQYLFARVFLLMLLASSLLIFVTGVWLWLKGSNIARFYTLAWGVLCFSCLAVVLDSLDIMEFTLPAHYLLMLGASLEAILLALILAMSQNKQRQALLNVQAELLEKERHTRHTEKNMLLLQENATEALEYKVQERTLELEVALRELSEKNQELEEKNTLDALTGIRNRSYFDKKYQAEVRRSRREQTQLSIVMLDIDHFKKVNDEYGHLVGDECIKTVAKMLQKSLKRPSDDVTRYGGEEFALILPNTNLEGAMVLVEQLRVEIETTAIKCEDVSIHITVSAGVGTSVAELNRPEDSILALADKQLYAAKNAGRNNVQGNHLDPIESQD